MAVGKHFDGLVGARCVSSSAPQLNRLGFAGIEIRGALICPDCLERVGIGELPGAKRGSGLGESFGGAQHRIGTMAAAWEGSATPATMKLGSSKY